MCYLTIATATETSHAELEAATPEIFRMGPDSIRQRCVYHKQ